MPQGPGFIRSVASSLGLALGLGLVALLPAGSARAAAASAPGHPAGSREERAGWIHVRLAGPAAERGRQHGRLLAAEIANEIRIRRVLWKHETSLDWEWLVDRASAMFTPKIDPEFLEEIDGIAAGMAEKGHTTTRAELVTYNAYFELSWYWWPKELKRIQENAVSPAKQACSAFIATGSATADGGIVLGHDTFFPYPMATANVVLEIQPDRGHRILMQTYPGWIHSGTDFFLTDAGLVGAETTMGGLDGFDDQGVPEFVRFRRATQYADSIDAWCARMREGNNGGYANAWLLGDIGTGEIARLELGLRHVAFERTRDGWFTGSNIAEDLAILRLESTDNDADIRDSSVARRVRWQALMRQYAGRIDVARARRLLADHHDAYHGRTRPGGRSLCGHSELEPQPGPGGAPFYPGGCFDGKVVDSTLARRMAFEGRWGAACGTPFRADRFLDRHPQFGWMRGILSDRPRQPWTRFEAAIPALPGLPSAAAPAPGR